MKAPITQTQAWAVIAESAGWNAKELPVLPKPACYWEPDGTIEWHKDAGGFSTNTGPAHGWKITHYYTADQLQAYGQQCAAHARELALNEAIAICRRNAQNTSADELEALKGK